MSEKTKKKTKDRKGKVERAHGLLKKKRMNLNLDTRFREHNVLGIMAEHMKMSVKMQTRYQNYGRRFR